MKRQHRSKEERRRIVEESLEPGASVAVVARSHGVNANQVFHWRKLYRDGLLDPNPPCAQLMPVCIADPPHEDEVPARACTGTIHLDFGRARICIEGSADPESLRVILEHVTQ